MAQKGYSGYSGDYENVPREEESARNSYLGSMSIKDGTGIKIGGSLYSLPNAEDFEDFDPWKHMDLKSKSFSNPAIAIYGARGTGKTKIMKHLIHTLQSKKHFDKGFLFSNTAHLQPGTYDFIPKTNQHVGFKEDVIAKIIAEQMQDVQTKKKNKQEKAIKRILLIFDDVINDHRIRHSPILNQLYTQGRHMYLCPCILTQEIGGAGGIPPTIRNNCDLVIGFNAGNQYDRDLMTERYLSLIHKKVGEHVYKDITSEIYRAIAIHFRAHGNSRKYQDYVYKYKAPEKDSVFTIGERLEDATKSTVKTFGGPGKFGAGLPTIKVALDEGGPRVVPQFSAW